MAYNSFCKFLSSHGLQFILTSHFKSQAAIHSDLTFQTTRASQFIPFQLFKSETSIHFLMTFQIKACNSFREVLLTLLFQFILTLLFYRITQFIRCLLFKFPFLNSSLLFPLICLVLLLSIPLTPFYLLVTFLLPFSGNLHSSYYLLRSFHIFPCPLANDF